MSDQYVAALRQRFSNDMQIKGCSRRRSNVFAKECVDFNAVFLGRRPE